MLCHGSKTISGYVLELHIDFAAQGNVTRFHSEFEVMTAFY